MSRGDVNAKQFSIRFLMMAMTAIAASLAVPKWAIFPVGVVAFLTFFCHYVAERERLASLFITASVVLILRGVMLPPVMDKAETQNPATPARGITRPNPPIRNSIGFTVFVGEADVQLRNGEIVIDDVCQ
jgi:hypothetical protein